MVNTELIDSVTELLDDYATMLEAECGAQTEVHRAVYRVRHATVSMVLIEIQAEREKQEQIRKQTIAVINDLFKELDTASARKHLGAVMNILLELGAKP